MHVYRAERWSDLGGRLLINTTPLFAIAFTALFLRGEEKITPMVLIGVVLLVAGIGFITAR